jgi:hypothetical protein
MTHLPQFVQRCKWIPLSLIILSTILALSLTRLPDVIASTTDQLGGHTVTFVGVEYDPAGYPAGTSKWTYDVTATTGVGRGISHWVLFWCGGAESILDASWTPWTYGNDPTTSIWGIKFDDLSEDADFKGETRTFWFVLNKHYTSGLTPVAVKDGAGTYVGSVMGPVFTYTLDLSAMEMDGVESVPEGYSAWQMVAVATTDYDLVTTVTFYWSGPFTEAETPDGSRLRLIEVDADGSDGFISYYPGRDIFFSDEDLGWWYVRAVFTGGRHPGEAAGIIDPAIVTPWFTSLPLTLLAAVGILHLKKKGITDSCGYPHE